MNVPTWVWWTTIGITIAIFVVDVAIVARRPHEPSRREVSVALSIYVGMAVLFGLGVLVSQGGQLAGEFFAGGVDELPRPQLAFRVSELRAQANRAGHGARAVQRHRQAEAAPLRRGRILRHLQDAALRLHRRRTRRAAQRARFERDVAEVAGCAGGVGRGRVAPAQQARADHHRLGDAVQQRADPWILRHTDGNYYFTASVPEYDRIILLLTDGQGAVDEDAIVAAANGAASTPSWATS